MMPELGKYAAPVLGAYGVAFLLLAGLIVLTLWQARTAKQRLDQAEKRAREASSDG